MAAMIFRKTPGIAEHDQWRVSQDNPKNWVDPQIQALRSSPSAQTIKVIVDTDPDEQVFLIPENLLLALSGRFKSLCDTTWVDSGKPPIRLPDEERGLFSMFQTWILEGDIERLRCEMEDEGHLPVVSQNMVELYAVAEEMQAPGLKDWLISMMIHAAQAVSVDEPPYFTPMNIAIIYALVPGDSKLKRLAVDTWVASGRVGGQDWIELKEEKETLCFEFLIDLVERLDSISESALGCDGDPEVELPDITENTCIYHEHGKGGFCPWTGKGLRDYADEISGLEVDGTDDGEI